MKYYIFSILLSVTFSLAGQNKRTATDEELYAIAESFLQDLYAAKYDTCLLKHHISYKESDYYMLSNVEATIKNCKNEGRCYTNMDYEFNPLHITYRSISRDEILYEKVTIYYDHQGQGYAFINLSNHAKGWFIGYADPKPNLGAKWNTYEKLETIKRRRDQ